jgi:hypothetical protein
MRSRQYDIKSPHSPEALDWPLNDTKQIFLKNQYPLKLINEKINNLKTKNFSPSESKAKRSLDSRGTKY